MGNLYTGNCVATTKFNPEGFYKFDLGAGAVHTATGERVVILPDNLLTALVSSGAGGAPISQIFVTLGKTLGSMARAAGGVDDASTPEEVLEHLRAAIALYGLGRLGMERWGQAIALELRDSSTPSEATGWLLSGLLEGISGRAVACVPVGDRFLVVHPSVSEQIKNWNLDSVGAAVAKLGGAS